MSTISNDSDYAGTHTVTLTETRWYERVWRFLPYLPREIPLFAAVSVSMWGVAGVFAKVSGEEIQLGALAFPTLLTAVAVAAYRAFTKFRAYVPEALLSESIASRSIYRKGKIGWQFDLARRMLKERVEKLDRTLKRVTNGAEFIPAKCLTLHEYSDWLQGRPTFVMRLVHSTATQCISELPSILASVESADQLSDLKTGVDELAKLYKHAVDFEVEGHSVQAPEIFENVHKKMHGWSAPIQNGIEEFTRILDQLACLDRKSHQAGTESVPQFTIVFDPPQNIDEFCNELEQIDMNSFIAP